MAISFPRLLGEINDQDTQFTATVKKYQEIVLICAVIVVVLIIWGIISFFSDGKRTGTWRYGLCKVFLEQYVSYPTSLVILMAEEGPNAARIGYLATNVYGAQVSEQMECFYNVTQQGVQLTRVVVDRRSLDLLNYNGVKTQNGNQNDAPPPNYGEINGLYQQSNENDMIRKVSQIHLDEFNKSIPVIMATDDLDLEMPAAIANNFEDLKYD